MRKECGLIEKVDPENRVAQAPPKLYLSPHPIHTFLIKHTIFDHIQSTLNTRNTSIFETQNLVHPTASHLDVPKP